MITWISNEKANSYHRFSF